jgi:hypothetical protein
MNKKFKYKFGNYFPIRIVIFAVLFIIWALYVIFSSHMPILGGIMLILPSFVCFTFKGVLIEIDSTNSKKYKEYYSYFGLKVGKWKSLDNYPYITIMSHRLSYNVSNFGAKGASIKEDFFEIFLLNQTHRHKILLKSDNNLEKISALIKQIAEELNVEIVKYNPVVSEKTMARRNLRR